MKQDRRVRRTRKALQAAYLRLCKLYQEDEISVSMITDEADINRATFYMHFTNKEDFIEEMLYDLLTGLEDAIITAFQHHSTININKLTPTTEVIFQYIEENMEALQALSKSHDDFMKRFEQLFHHIFTERIYIETKSPKDNLNYDIFIHYQTKATLGLIQYWIISNSKYSKEYMMDQLTLLSNTQITSLQLKS
ncbi:TetR/AcrR family transcriptional regulator [Lederbergia graminis]|uniref:TetR/AcrR family transcriptional regulator n=1 Tax=Lederbergia graminis TaxID=735518 RepID=A0ABW0LE57_9BACI